MEIDIAEIEKFLEDQYMQRHWYHMRPHRLWQKHASVELTYWGWSRVDRCSCGAMRRNGMHWVYGDEKRRTVRKWKRDNHGN